MTIPDTINFLPVTGPGNGAFANHANLTALEFGTNLLRNNILKSLIINKAILACFFDHRTPSDGVGGLTSIQPSDALLRNNILKSLIINEAILACFFDHRTPSDGVGGLTSIQPSDALGNGTFFGCSGLVAFAVNLANPAYTSVGGILFSKNLDALVAYPRGLSAPTSSPAR